MLVFNCPSCGAKLQMTDDLAGKKVRCASCQAVVTAPDIRHSIQGEEAAVKATVPSSAIESGPAKAAARDDDVDDRPRRRSRDDAAVATAAAATGAGVGIMGILIAGVAVLFGGGCCVAVLAALLVPAVQKVREAAARTQTMNNMKEIALAFHSHADINQGRLPPPKEQRNPQGKPVELSWRVSVLPFVMSPDAKAAANRFDMTNAWDSPRNQPAANPMPKIYTHVLRDEPGQLSVGTLFQTFTGPGTLWPDNGIRRFPAGIPDGTSNTFLFAEAAKSVPWTKPADMTIVPGQAAPLPAGSFLVAFCDGSVRMVDRTRVNDQTLRLYIDPADGNPVPPLD